MLCFSRCTVPVPRPTILAVLRTPVPSASSRRAASSFFGSALGRPKRWRFLPALLMKWPSHAMASLARASPALTRATIISRSNSLKMPSIPVVFLEDLLQDPLSRNLGVVHQPIQQLGCVPRRVIGKHAHRLKGQVDDDSGAAGVMD